MENMESIQRKISETKMEKSEPKEIDLADLAVKEAIESIIKKLEEEQKESKDDFFKKLKIRELTPEALMILNISMKEEERSLPKDVLKNAFEVVKESNIYNNSDAYGNTQERLACIEDIIIHYPNTFYKKKENF